LAQAAERQSRFWPRNLSGEVGVSSMKGASAVLLACALFGVGGATELTKATFDDAVAGKTVFIKFLAPW